MRSEITAVAFVVGIGLGVLADDLRNDHLNAEHRDHCQAKAPAGYTSYPSYQGVNRVCVEVSRSITETIVRSAQ